MSNATRGARAPSAWAGPRHRAALTLAAAVLAGGAQATDYRWTGGAGSGASFWDLAANWTPGLPAGPDARALLGAHHTTLRSGSFDIASVHGTGRLSFTGGTLRLNGDASGLWAMHLDGGTLQGRMNLTHLRWDRGSFGPLDPLSDSASHLVVGGNTTIGPGGDKYVGYGATVEWRGTTRWLDGDSSMAFDGRLALGPGSRFEDHVARGSHGLSVAGGFVNAGTYVKTGSGTSALSMPYAGPLAENRGTLRVLEGRYEVRGAPADARWHNSGRLEVARGAVFALDISRGGFSHTGTAQIDGRAELRTPDSDFDSSGQWLVGSSGVLRIVTGGTFDPARGAYFSAGTLRNEGVLAFEGGEAHFTSQASLTGRGQVEVTRGAALVHANALSVGTLRLDSVVAPGWHEPYWGRVQAPSLTVERLDWGVGDLRVAGPILVTGTARLHGGPQYWVSDGAGRDVPGYRRQIDGKLVLNAASWTGETDIVGSGRIVVSRGGVFRDEAAADLAPREGTARPVVLGLAAFENHGLHLKTGAGRTEASGRYYNAGRVLTHGGGALIFTGMLNTPGTLHARGARIDVRGGLAQWSPAERRLTGGTYIAERQTLGLDLQGAGGIARNSARIELRGSTARLVDNHGGVDRPALATLALNDGSLRLLAGASMVTQSALRNAGEVVVAAGSRLASAGRYTQSGPSARTWIDGTLQAGGFSFEGGVWGAGLDGTVGRASLLGGAVTLRAGQLDVDILGGSLYDVVWISGRATLGGSLHASFAEAAGEGTYRVLTAGGGLAGSFAAIVTDLDPAVYRLEVRYAAQSLDLVVSRLTALEVEGPQAMLPTSPVPELQTYALMLVGLGALAARVRRRRR